MELRDEWSEVLNRSCTIYIYGAGKVGKRIFHLIKRENKQQKVKGFLVSNLDGNPSNIEGIPVYQVDAVSEKDTLVLLSVTDIYQNEILETLKEKAFSNILYAYKYSFLEYEGEEKETPDTITIDLRELLMQQFLQGGGENQFLRYDIIVRLLAVEDYYGLNDIGFGLYKKMQDLRVRPGYSSYAVKRYLELISSVENNGYIEDSEIIVDRNLRLLDGAHRIALAIYYKVLNVKIRILDREEEIKYGMKWFSDHFCENACNMIIKKFNQISREWLYPIKGILWPPVSKYFDEITNLIGSRYRISSYTDYDFPEEIFLRFIHGVYHLDDIAEWKVAAKIEHMLRKGLNKVRILDIDMKSPDFRVKRTGKTISQEGERLKKLIRDKYSNMVDDYFYDIIFHTSDNYLQSEFIGALVNRAFSLKKVLERIEAFDWMLIKTDNNYFPEDFPRTYPFYKDIDIICKREHVGILKREIMDSLSENLEDRYQIRKVVNRGNIRLRIELKGFLIFQFDVMYEDEYLTESFVNDSLSRKIKLDEYYICDTDDELVYRIVDFYKHPNKRNHLEYIKKYLTNSSDENLWNGLCERHKDAIRNFIKERV